LCQGRQSYTTKHTFHALEQGNCTTTVAVVRSYTHTSQRRQPKQRKAAWFLYVLIHLKLSPQAVHARYRYRFGIEASYRPMRQLRARTTSRNPVLRFLFIALGFLLNLWLRLRFRFCQRPQRGRVGRSLDEAHVRLARFATFLSRAIEQIYGAVVAISTTVLPLGL
jgi:IS4 transposase